MSGLVGRSLAVVRGWWRRASTRVLGLLRGAVRVARTVALRVGGYATTVLAAVRARHQDRLARDAGYRTAIATGLSALLVTITPQPAVAAALAVLVSEHLGSPRRSQDADYAYDDDRDGYEAYDARRPWSSPSAPRPPQRLWNAFTD